MKFSTLSARSRDFKASLKQELQPHNLLPSLAVGLILGFSTVLHGLIPAAALIFSGNLSSFLAPGIGLTLFGAAIIGIVMALGSSCRGMLGSCYVHPLLAVIAASVARGMPPGATPDAVFQTVVAAIAVTSVIAGLALFILGQFKLAELMRFLPYPVIAGFLAGLGYLCLLGSVTVMTEINLNLSTLPLLFAPHVLARWFPGLVFAVVLFVLFRRSTHFLLLPTSILTAIALFHIALLLTHTSVSEASQAGWLLGPFPKGTLWQPLSLFNLTQANWPLVFGQLNGTLGVMLLHAISVVIAASGIEVATEQDIDLNQELRATGLANILSGLGDSSVGGHSTTTLLAHKMGARSRLLGIFFVLPSVVLLFVGLPVLASIPKVVVGGLLLFFGLDLLVEWIYRSFFKLPLADYAIVVLITVVIATVGFVEGTVTGLVVAIIFFVVNYSRIGAAKYILSGADFRSRVVRPLNQERLLQKKGEQLYLFQLQGLIFFGTAHQLLQKIRQRLLDSELEPLRFVLLDFRLVHGLDSSAVLSFMKMKQMLLKQEIGLLLVHLSPLMERQLQQGGVLGGLESETSLIQVFPDRDRALEWCESQILAASKYRRPRSLPLVMQLKSWFEDAQAATDFMHYLEERRCAEGELIFCQGERPEALYFIQSGQVSTFTEVAGSPACRVQTSGAGTLVGEIEFSTRSPYQVSAISDRSSKLYLLSREAWAKIQRENPQTAVIFSQFLNTLLSERLLVARQEIETLLR
jgi:SulP family sulfate permease